VLSSCPLTPTLSPEGERETRGYLKSPIFHPREEEDVAEAATWYETRQPGLGAQLLDQRQRRRQLQVSAALSWFSI
jgi:hypothetical protein